MNYIKTLPRFINKIHTFNTTTNKFINLRFFAHQQIFPTFAESVDSGEVTEINCKEGQFVKEGEMLAVVDIEKSTIELFAEKGGLVTKLFVKEGDSVKPKDAFLTIDDTAIDANAASTPEPTPKAETSKTTEATKATEVPKATPVKSAPAPTKASPVLSNDAPKPVPKMIVTDFVATTERTE